MAVDPVIKWLPYQRAWIEDDSRFKIGMMTRRGGKTYGTMGEVAKDCIDHEIARQKTRWTILSRSERTAVEAMDDALKPMIRAYYEVYKTLRNAGAPEFDESAFTDPGYEREVVADSGRVFVERVPEATYRQLDVRFPGGSRITALSASPGAARGFGGNLVLDEFAFHRDSRLIWAAAMPVAARGGHKVRAISTPNGRGNKFHEVMTAETGEWSRHVVDIYTAVEQGLDIDIAQLRAAIADEDVWAQEFELKWADASSAWLDYELIVACEAETAGQPRFYRGGPCFVGVDIAARNDLFVIWVDEEVAGQLVTREVVAERNVSFQRQADLLAGVFDRYRVVRCAMDQTGMGEKPVEDAQRAHGQDRVEGVLFSVATKLALATELKARMQDRRKLIPAGDPLMRADLHAVKSVVGPTGLRRLVADGETDGHADRFWAAALAASAAVSEYQPLSYRPVRRGDDIDRAIRLTGGFGAGKGVW